MIPFLKEAARGYTNRRRKAGDPLFLRGAKYRKRFAYQLLIGTTLCTIYNADVQADVGNQQRFIVQEKKVKADSGWRKEQVILSVVSILTASASGVTVASAFPGWNNASNTVECIGGGGNGGTGGSGCCGITGAGGGGGGGYAKNLNISLGATVNYVVGAATGSTSFNAGTTATGGANGGSTAGGAGGNGGAATAHFTGGSGGAGGLNNGGGGGGGAAGLNANGVTGSNGTGGAAGPGGNGGRGDGTFGGTGGTGGASNAAGNPGNPGTEYTTAGSGGGGGGAANNASAGNAGGAGGLYGGGGGGSGNGGGLSPPGSGVQGVIVVTWTPTFLAKRVIILQSVKRASFY